MQKTSVRAAARDAKAQEKRAAKEALLQGTAGRTLDSFQNMAQKMGIGADNAMSTSRYGFNPITRNRIQLEWVHRGSWLGGVAIDIVADDMTREGAELACEMDPNDMQAIERNITDMGVWDQLGDCIRWGRLYGGALAVMLVDRQDLRTPLRSDSVGAGQFKGLLVLDRWMLEPVLDDLVTEFGPDLGLPKFYRVLSNAPALRGSVIHHSRIAVRHLGVPLPYQQALTENLWGLSVIERLWDRMTMFDSASTGAGQLVFKAWLRTMKIEDLRTVVASGGKALDGLMQYMDIVRRYQNIEGITLLDSKDEFEVQEHGAFSGLADVVQMFAEQLSGALQIPLTRLLGQSPGGLNSDGAGELRTYYDNIKQRQGRDMHRGVTTIYELTARSCGIEPPKDFAIEFASLWQLDTTQRTSVAKDAGEAIGSAFDRGLLTQQGAMKDLKQISKVTGVFSNITADEIEQADDELTAPSAEDAAQPDPNAPSPDLTATHEHTAEQADLQRQHEADMADADRKHEAAQADRQRAHQMKMTDKTLQAKKQEKSNADRSREKRPVGGSSRKRNRL